MKPPSQLHSPKQVALALGVSESSLKRWCDRGLIPTVRTGGGHRKLQTSDVLDFARQQGMELASPELLGLPALSPQAESSLERSVPLLVDALIAGDESRMRQIMFNLTMASHSLSRIFDEVVAQAFQEIGELWACRLLDVYQERRGCDIMHRILIELCNSQPAPLGPLIACGGNCPGNVYSLPTLMVELVLRECNYRATSFGTSLPFESLVRAVEEIRPALFWVSCSYIPVESEFLQGIEKLSATCSSTETALVIGGREITPALRQQILLRQAVYCENMQQLATFATSLRRATRHAPPKVEQADLPPPPLESTNKTNK